MSRSSGMTAGRLWRSRGCSLDVGRQAGVKELAKVEAGCSELFRSRWIAAGAGQLAVFAYEDLRRLDDPVFDPAGDADDLVYPTSTVWLGADVDDKVEAGRNGWHDERTGYVLACEERQCAHLGDGLACRVRVQGGHAGNTAVQRYQQVEALRLAYLADDDAGRPHAERLLDQAAESNLACTFE